MKVLNRTSDGLKRSYDVIVFRDEVTVAIENKLKEIAKDMRVDGFRPGKVPVETAMRKYGDAARQDALKKLISDTVKKVFQEDNLSTSLEYTAEVVSDAEDGVTFVLKFETLPSFELLDISSLNFTKHVVQFGDAEIEKYLNIFVDAIPRLTDASESDVVAETDNVTIDFNSKLKNGKEDLISGVSIDIGDTNLVDDFWRHLIGAKAGETREFIIHYPSDYTNKKMAGKDIQTTAKIKKISKKEKHSLNDEFAVAIGKETLEKAKEWARDIIKDKHEKISSDIIKRDLLSKLSEMYDFEVPQNMVKVEHAEVVRQIKVEADRLGKEVTPAIEEECEDIALQRVRLGFIIAETAKINGITVTNQEVLSSIKDLVMSYPGHEKEMWDFYTRDATATHAIRGAILEDKVVKYLIQQVNLTEIQCTEEELVALDEEVFEFFADDGDTDIKSKEISDTDKQVELKTEETKEAKAKPSAKKNTETDTAKEKQKRKPKAKAE